MRSILLASALLFPVAAMAGGPSQTANFTTGGSFASSSGTASNDGGGGFTNAGKYGAAVGAVSGETTFATNHSGNAGNGSYSTSVITTNGYGAAAGTKGTSAGVDFAGAGYASGMAGNFGAGFAFTNTHYGNW